jgi:predicted MPP superfamily phosphohydrolase
MLAGHINASYPRVRVLDLQIAKKARGQKNVNILAASDIHLGTLVGKRRLQRLVDTAARLQPDLIIFPGDIVDEDLRPVIKNNVGEALKELKAPLGVIAVTGNHEYIGGVEQACQYLTDHGILMLRDDVIKLGDSFYLIGREDREIKAFTGKLRKPLDELMASVDKTWPIILLDHEPFQLEESASGGVDLQISGHTHHGQLWPLTYITDVVYELSSGYLRKKNTHIYVSTGFGTWGPPVRTGNRPEIVIIKLSFE